MIDIISKMGTIVRKIPAAEAGKPRGPGRPRDLVFEKAIVHMQIGDCIEVNARPSTIRQRLTSLKKRHNWLRRYSMKLWAPGITRIWRIQ